MPKIILTADVQNGVEWEKTFRTHVDLFKAANIGSIDYTIGSDNHAVLCTDVDDVGTYLNFVNSAATQEAMKGDGVKRETVKVYVLDKKLVS